MRIAIIAIMLALAAGGALAQTADEAAGTLDLGPLVELGVEYLAVALGAAALWLFNRFVAPVLGEAAADRARAGLDGVIRRGIRLAADRLEVADRFRAVEVKNDLVREAAAYVIASAPGWLDKFGVGPDRVSDMVRARFGEEIAAIERETAAPATQS